MKRKGRKKKKFKGVSNLQSNQKNSMKDREVSLEETQLLVQDLSQNQHICTEPWLKINQV